VMEVILRQGLLCVLTLLSYLGAAFRSVSSVGWFPMVVGIRWCFCAGGVLSMVRVFVGSLFSELRL
jgi:hypothetical protein